MIEVEQVVELLENQIIALNKILKYAEAIADIIYKDFCWIFFCQRIVEENWKILKSPQHIITSVLSTWMLKADKYEIASEKKIRFSLSLHFSVNYETTMTARLWRHLVLAVLIAKAVHLGFHLAVNANVFMMLSAYLSCS